MDVDGLSGRLPHSSNLCMGQYSSTYAIIVHHCEHELRKNDAKMKKTTTTLAKIGANPKSLQTCVIKRGRKRDAKKEVAGEK